jgi:hypothetical protein
MNGAEMDEERTKRDQDGSTMTVTTVNKPAFHDSEREFSEAPQNNRHGSGFSESEGHVNIQLTDRGR